MENTNNIDNAPLVKALEAAQAAVNHIKTFSESEGDATSRIALLLREVIYDEKPPRKISQAALRLVACEVDLYAERGIPLPSAWSMLNKS